MMTFEQRKPGNVVSRRSLLTAGAATAFGLSLPELLAAEAQSRSGRVHRSGRAKSVVLLYLFGGPPKHELFDPKPKAPEQIRGPFGVIDTDLAGVQFCELVPKMSRWLRKSTLVRSATHPHNDHSAGLLYTMTGRKALKLESAVPTLPTQAPCMNSVLQYLSRNEQRDLPASVWMPCYPGWGQKSQRPGAYAGFLGSRFDPLITTCELQETRPRRDFYDASIQKGRITLPETALPAEMSLARLDQRRLLLNQFDAGQGSAGPVAQLGHFQQQAFDLLNSSNSPNSPWRAFDIEDEPAAVRELYGRHLYGQSALVARRLIERGVRLVTLYWESFHQREGDAPAWDTHRNHFNIMRDYRAPVLVQAFDGLCRDLQCRGLLDETLIVVMGEMGRTPKPNSGAGRDHWSYNYDVLFTGAGVRHGAVFGESDETGAYPKSHPVGPEDIIATVYSAMGIETSATIRDTAGRPHPIAQHGRPIDGVLA